MRDEKPILARYLCSGCMRQTSKWTRPRGVCWWCREHPTSRIGGNIGKRIRSDSMRGAKSYKWQGDSVGYDGVHAWLRREVGPATYCANDETHKSKRYELANISGEYRRDINDYKPLCPSCHRKYDMSEEYIEMLRERTAQWHINNLKPVAQYTKDGTFIATYPSIKEAAEKIGKPGKRVSDALTGRKKTAGGYVWRYAEPTGEGATV